MKHFTFLSILLLLSTTFFGQDAATCGFSNKKVITIQGSQISGGPHTDFPILIDHTDGVNLTTAAAKVTSANGFDIVFADDNGNLLDFQLENYNGTTGQIVAWVKIPTLTNGTDVDIHMLYGKATIVTDQSTTGVWSANYQGVWHLHDNFSDGSANGVTGTNNGSIDVSPALIGDGQNFTASNHWIELPTFPNQTGDFTISAWINTSDNTLAGQRIFCDDRFNSSGGYALSLGDGGTGRLRFFIRGMGSTILDIPTNIIANNTWYYVVAVADIAGDLKHIYVNGTLVVSTVNAGTLNSDAGNAAIGGEVAAGEAGFRFDGNIDEVRMASAARSGNWIATQYAAQNNPEGMPNPFYIITNEINNTYTSNGNGDWDLPATWTGPPTTVPHVGANVTINERVVVNAGSEDYTICSCTVSNSTGNAAYLDMDNGRILTIIEDLTVTNSNITEVDLTLDDNGTTLNVLGNMIVTNSATAATDVEIDLDEASVMSITGNLTVTATAGDIVEFDLSETGDLDVGGNLLIDQDGGNGIFFFIDTDATFDVAGDAMIDQDGGDNINIEINNAVNGSAAFRVAGNLSIDHNGGDDIVFVVDDASSFFQVGGNLDVDWDSTDDDDLTFNLDGGNFTVIGTSTFSRKNDAHEIFFDMDGGDYTTGAFTFNNSGTNDADHSLFVNVDATSTFTINGNLTINETGGNNIEMSVNNNSNIDINGNVAITNNGAEDVILSSTGTNSLFDVSGSLLIDHNGETDSEFRIDLNSGTMTVGGTFIANRIGDSGPIFFDLDGGDFNANSGMTLTSTGVLFSEGALIFDIDNNSIFTCTGNMAATMTGADDFRVAVNNNVGTVGEFNCTGNLTIIRTAGDDIEFFANDDNSLIQIGGNLSITTTGGEQVLFDIDNDATINVDGNMSITATEGQVGLLILRNTGIPSLDVAGDFNLTIAGGNDDYTIDLDAGEITVGQDMTLTESTGDNQLVLDMDGGNLSVTRDFFANLSGAGTATELIVDLDNGTVMTVGRDVELDISGGNDIEFHLEQNNTAGTAQLNVTRNFTLDHNGATGGDDLELLINNDAIVTVGNNFTMDTDGSGAAGNFVTQLNDNSLLDVNGNIIMNSVGSGLLQMILTNASKLELTGNFVRQASPNNFGLLTASGTSTIEYNGVTNVQIFAEDAGAGTDVFDYENVIINNSFGTSPQITMEGLATVRGDITFTDGIIASTSTNLLVLEDNSDALSESDASFVDGPVKKIGNDAFDFPVGDSLQLQQISMTAPGLVTDEFTGQYFEVNVRPIFNGNSLDPTIDHISACEYWTLDRTLGTSNVQVTLNYDANSCGVTDLTSLIVARWDGATWRDHMGTVAGTLASGTVQTPAVVTNFSPFTLASTNSANPLPIELLSFDAVANQDQQIVDLFWSTASEINNDFFTIQRSINGFDWENLAKVNGAGNSSSILNYDENDLNPYKGLSYYRLSQTDFDGTTTYSKIIPINLLIEGNPKIVVFPNPTSKNNTVNITLQGFEDSEIKLSLIDVLGKVVIEKKIELTNLKENSQHEKRISFGKIPEGTYIIIASSENNLLRQKLIVR